MGIVAPWLSVFAIGGFVVCFIALRRRQSVRQGVEERLDLAGRWADAGEFEVATRALTGAEHASGAEGDRVHAALAMLHLRQGRSGYAAGLLGMRPPTRSRFPGQAPSIVDDALAYTMFVAGAGAPLRRGTSAFRKVLGNHGERVCALLRAFAESQLPASSSRHRHIADLLTTARPTIAAEFDYLVANRPSLGIFLARHTHELQPQPPSMGRTVLPRSVAHERN